MAPVQVRAAKEFPPEEQKSKPGYVPRHRYMPEPYVLPAERPAPLPERPLVSVQASPWLANWLKHRAVVEQTEASAARKLEARKQLNRATMLRDHLVTAHGAAGPFDIAELAAKALVHFQPGRCNA